MNFTSRIILKFVFIACLFPLTSFAQVNNCLELSSANIGSVNSSTPCMLLVGKAAAENQSFIFQKALDKASQFGIILYLRGSVYPQYPMKLSSNTRLYGDPSHHNVIKNHLNQVSAILVARSAASNITLKGFDLLEGPQVSTALLLLSGKNEDINVSFVNFTGRAVEQDATSLTTAGVYLAADFGRRIYVRDSSFTELQYGVHTFAPVQDLKVNRNTFTRWTHVAVRVFNAESYAHRRVKDIQISTNTFTNPANGVINSVIFISRGFGDFVRSVSVTSNRIIGPGEPWIRSNISGNNGTTDQIVLQGVNLFTISKNLVYAGGENGITASRLSRNGSITRNLVFQNDGNGIGIGSSYAELTVTSTNGFSLGDQVQGARTGTRGEVKNIVGNRLWINRVSGGSLFFAESLHNITTGQNDASFILSNDRTKNIVVARNKIYDNGQNKEGTGALLSGIWIKDSDRITVLDNEIYNTDFLSGIITQTFGVNIVNSRGICLLNSNLYEEGNVTQSQAVVMTSSSWLDPQCPL